MAIELERTYLAKSVPVGLAACRSKEIADSYLPANSAHAKLRVRKNGERLEATKKVPVDGDVSRQMEHTIPLDADEYAALMAIPGKKVRKIRYYYESEGRTAEIDVFQDGLQGLVLVDFEFEDEKAKNGFEMPDFCLAEVTKEEFVAGGAICGKTYADIEPELRRFGYEKLAV